MSKTKIIFWNTFHGDASLIIHGNQGIVIDLGANPNVFRKHTKELKKVLRHFALIFNSKIRIAYITHYHYDHYSLLATYLNAFKKNLSNLFLPAIPKNFPEEKKLFYELAVYFMILKKYYAIPILTESADRVNALARGDSIIHDPILKAEILWPPLDMSDMPEAVKNRIKIRVIEGYEIGKKIAKEENLDREVDDVYDKLIGIYSEKKERQIIEIPKTDLSLMSDFNDVETREDNTNIDSLLTDFSFKKLGKNNQIKKFIDLLSKLGNDISLVIRFYLDFIPFALFLGDVPDDILDHLDAIEQKLLKISIFLRAAHHGTHYGQYLNGYDSCLTWISWTKYLRKGPRIEYFKDIDSIYTLLAEHFDYLEVYVRGFCHFLLKGESKFKIRCSECFCCI